MKMAKDASNVGWVDLLVRASAECLGTTILVFVGCLSCVNSLGTGVTHVSVCISFGVAVLIIVQTFGHISGAHVNPAVTVAAAILGQMKNYGMVPVYIISQMLGAILGYALLYAVTPYDVFWRMDPITGEGMDAWCLSSVHPSIDWWRAIIIEMFLTACLIWICAGVWDHRNKNNMDSIAIKFGLAITGLAMAGGFYTGASMNPARSFGPALIANHWKNQWIYWVGPFSGSVLSALLYKYLFSVPEPEPEPVYVEEIPLQTNSKRGRV